MVKNQVTLFGRMTKDPEVRYTSGSNMAVCKFNLAVERAGKEKETDFIGCVAFGKTAELLGKYVGKGCRIAIGGSIRTGSYEGKNGMVYTTDVNVSDIDIIDFKNSGKEMKETKEETRITGFDFMPVDEDPEEDLPF